MKPWSREPGFSYALLGAPRELVGGNRGIWGAREELARILTVPQKRSPGGDRG